MILTDNSRIIINHHGWTHQDSRRGHRLIETAHPAGWKSSHPEPPGTAPLPIQDLTRPAAVCHQHLSISQEATRTSSASCWGALWLSEVHLADQVRLGSGRQQSEVINIISRLIFSLDGVGKECTTDQVDVIFDKWSLELKLRGYKGQNYIFSIKKLFAEIIPGDSKYILKNNSLNIVLVKRDNKSWSQISFKEDKLETEKKEEKNEDPQAGIMNMMKKMYEEGDDNMKRTIAEAWTKANDKKSQGEQPDFSSRYDFLKKWSSQAVNILIDFAL